MTKPTYVDLDGETVYRPPYEQAGTHLTAWPLKADRNALQAICDKAFNQPSGGAVEYRPVLSTVLLVFANIEKVTSLDSRDKSRGWVDEVDICFWMLVGAYKEKNGKKELDHLVWYIPYIWVTNGYTMATGREVFGYPKAFGWANLPLHARDQGPFWADALVIPQFTADTPVTRQRIVEVTREPEHFGSLTEWAEHEKTEAFLAIAKILADVGEADCDWPLLLSIAKDLLGFHIPSVFLKQFRDATSSTAACYQAIIETNFTINGFRGAGLLPEGWSVDVRSYASHQIVKTLGLGPGPYQVDRGFWVNLDFAADLGKEVWRAPG